MHWKVCLMHWKGHITSFQLISRDFGCDNIALMIHILFLCFIDDNQQFKYLLQQGLFLNICVLKLMEVNAHLHLNFSPRIKDIFFLIWKLLLPKSTLYQDYVVLHAKKWIPSPLPILKNSSCNIHLQNDDKNSRYSNRIHFVGAMSTSNIWWHFPWLHKY